MITRGWPLASILYWSEKQGVAPGIQNILGWESEGGPFSIYYIGMITRGWPLANILYWAEKQKVAPS
jgi:hypothetical protein